MKKTDKKYLLIGGGLLLAGALIAWSRRRTIPKGVQAVHNFDKQRYLGKWYEIARFDYIFERGLNNTTAEYAANEDGTIKVVNKGYNTRKAKYQSAVGKAKFTGDEQVARLKVSFFGPFYAGYNVIALDNDYRYALVAGKNRDYLWLLSREKSMPEEVIERYLNIARSHGFKVEDLTWVKHD